MSRTTEYTEAMLNRAEAYRDAPRADKVKIPTIEGLAVFLKVSRSTLYKWAGEQPQFSDILDEIMTLQGQVLIENGLSGEFNSTITKLMLTKHGYSDKIDTDITSGGKPVPIYGGASIPNQGHDGDEKDISAPQTN